MTTIDDGYILGTFHWRPRRCGHCQEKAVCIDIVKVTLPKGVTVKATILQDRSAEEPKDIATVGIDCGCYAKFHRQVTHIVRSRVDSGHVV